MKRHAGAARHVYGRSTVRAAWGAMLGAIDLGVARGGRMDRPSAGLGLRGEADVQRPGHHDDAQRQQPAL